MCLRNSLQETLYECYHKKQKEPETSYHSFQVAKYVQKLSFFSDPSPGLF